MNDNDKEVLSALMDNEGDAFSLRRLLSSTDAEALSQTWSRYHAAQQVIQGSGSEQFLHLDISKRVAAAINNDETTATVAEVNTHKQATHNVSTSAVNKDSLAANTNTGKQNWIRAAVAASVAVAVVIGAGGLGGFSVNSPQISVGANVAATQGAQVISPLSQLATATQSRAGLQTVSATIGSNTGKSTVSSAPVKLTSPIGKAPLDVRYNRYLLQHVEQTSLNGRQGMMNYARMSDYQDF